LLWGGVALVALALGIALLLRYRGRPPAEGSAQSSAPDAGPPPFQSPYLNTRPGVKYTGDAACVECHETHGEHYRRHPMGRSVTPVSAVTSLDGHVSSGGTPFPALGVWFSAERRGAGLLDREVARDSGGRIVAETAAPVDYVIGSGAHAYSYLLNRDGVLTQSPVSWYRQKKALDLSPGFGPGPELFERPIAPGCLFCHANHAEAKPDAMNKYRGAIFTGHAIGCERCHEPGELHVADRAALKPVSEGGDLTIVNPSSLPPGLRDDVSCNTTGSLGRGTRPGPNWSPSSRSTPRTKRCCGSGSRRSCGDPGRAATHFAPRQYRNRSDRTYSRDPATAGLALNAQRSEKWFIASRSNFGLAATTATRPSRER
jgi:hypothetical protein